MVMKGKAIEQRARAGDWDKRHPAFELARQTFISANKIDTEDPEALFEYYTSYLMEGVRPTDNAIAALHYASDLAPQDLGVRMNSAIAYLNEGKPKDARATLTIVAYSPHANQMAETAKTVIAEPKAGDPRLDAIGDEQKRRGDDEPAEAAEQAQAERGPEQRHASL